MNTEIVQKNADGVWCVDVSSCYDDKGRLKGVDWQTISKELATNEIRHLKVTNEKNLPTIPANFIQSCTALTSLDLTSLVKVSKVEIFFLYNCTGLTSVDFPPSSDVTEVGGFFMALCTGLTSIDLRSFSKLHKVGDSFLASCSRLTSIDLTSLSNLTHAGHSFLFNSAGVTSFDLSPLGKLETVGDSFLGNCFRLSSIDLAPLRSLTVIGDAFMGNCAGLTSIDLTPLSNVKKVGEKFLTSCPKLTSVILPRTNQVLIDACKGLKGVRYHDDIPATPNEEPVQATSPRREHLEHDSELLAQPQPETPGHKAEPSINGNADLHFREAHERDSLRDELTATKKAMLDVQTREKELKLALASATQERDSRAHELAAAKQQLVDSEQRARNLEADAAALRDLNAKHKAEVQSLRSKIPTGRVDCFALDQLQDVRELGSGGFGSVMLVRALPSNRLLAMKVPFSLPQLREIRAGGALPAATAEARYAATRDYLIASRIHHPHVVPFAGLVGTMEEPIGMLMEYVDGGSLDDAIVKPGRKPSLCEFLRIAVDLTSAVAHLHAHGVWHRDIKPQNVLIDSSGHIYLADFGSASRGDIISDATVTVTSTNVALTFKYLDPQRNRKGPGDVYALGLTLLEVSLARCLVSSNEAPRLVSREVHTILRDLFHHLVVDSDASDRDTAAVLLQKFSALRSTYAPHAVVGSAWTEDLPGAWLPLGSSTTVFPLQHLPPELAGRIPVVSLCSSLSPDGAGDLLRALPALLPPSAPVIRDLSTPASVHSGVVLLIRNAVLEGSFEARMRLLRSRSVAYYDSNGKACASWKDDTLVDGSKPPQQHTPDVLGHRDAVMARLSDRVWKPFPANVDGDPVRVALLFHATTLEAALQIADAGFMSYARLDAGYFGKGLYFTPDFAYARDVYAADMMTDGKRVAIIAAYVCVRHVFPCVDMSMMGKSNRGGYDAHAAVVSQDHKYKPVTKSEWKTNWNGLTNYLEVVVFDCAQALPAAVVVL